MSKVLVFDIETSPNIVYSWRTGYNINLGPENIVQEREVICIAYKWSGEKKVHSLTWDMSKKSNRDKQMLKKFAKVYAEADMVVAHNGDKFDIKWLRTRILHHGLDPLPLTKQCDTLKEFRRMFNFNSNKLDYVAKFLGYEGKQSMCFQDWIDIMNGSKKALTKMDRYCKQDVQELDQIFIATRPYIDGNGINQALSGNKDCCPSCGDEHQIRYGIYHTKVGRYQKYRCMNCKHVWKDTRQLRDN